MVTGEEIQKQRLDAIPWARYSLKAQAELEKRGGFAGPKLGETGSLVPLNGFDKDEQPNEEEA